MSDEFDDAIELPATNGSTATGRRGRAVSRASARACRLAARLFVSAGLPLRARMIGCLLRPLGTLGAAGVAAGAFAVFLHSQRGAEALINPDAVAGVSASQVCELARFVEQVDPQALRRFAGLMAGSAEDMAPLGATTLVLLYRELQPLEDRG